MKKIVMMVAIMMVAMNVFAGEMTILKDRYDTLTNSVDRVKLVGSQAVLDSLIASNWDEGTMLDYVKANPSVDVTTLALRDMISYMPKARLAEALLSVGTRGDKYFAISAAYSNWRQAKSTDLSALFALDNPVNSVWADFLVKVSARRNELVGWNDLTIPECVEFLCLPIDNHIVFKRAAVSELNRIKGILLKQIEPYARIAIRARGESFVPKDGVNPVEVEMKPVVDALNAPKLVGLTDALLAIGVDVQPNALTTMDWTGIETYFAEVNVNAAPVWHEARLVVLLGVDGFNTWVKSYNGE